jgi:hypothetical protein
VERTLLTRSSVQSVLGRLAVDQPEAKGTKKNMVLDISDQSACNNVLEILGAAEKVK